MHPAPGTSPLQMPALLVFFRPWKIKETPHSLSNTLQCKISASTVCTGMTASFACFIKQVGYCVGWLANSVIQAWWRLSDHILHPQMKTTFKVEKVRMELIGLVHYTRSCHPVTCLYFHPVTCPPCHPSVCPSCHMSVCPSHQVSVCPSASGVSLDTIYRSCHVSVHHVTCLSVRQLQASPSTPSTGPVTCLSVRQLQASPSTPSTAAWTGPFSTSCLARWPPSPTRRTSLTPYTNWPVIVASCSAPATTTRSSLAVCVTACYSWPRTRLTSGVWLNCEMSWMPILDPKWVILPHCRYECCIIW